MRTFRFALIVALAFSLAACCACRRSRSAVPLQGTEWALSQLYGTPVPSDNYRVTLAEDGRISGIGDCNRFTGTYTQDGSSLKIADNLASTRMMCLNQAQEDKFLGMLREIDSYNIDGSHLMLIAHGDVMGIFEAIPALVAEPAR